MTEVPAAVPAVLILFAALSLSSPRCPRPPRRWPSTTAVSVRNSTTAASSPSPRRNQPGRSPSRPIPPR